MSRILVTGSAGYIGSVLVPHLQSVGHEVVGYDIGWFGRDTAKWSVVGDIRTPLVNPAWPEVVVHLAGLSNDPLGDLAPVLTTEINKWGTIDMVRAYPEAHHIIVSSCAVYGQSSVLCTEESPTNPQTAYAKCKAAVDEWVMADGYDITTLRLGTVFGPSPNHRLDLVVNRMVYDVINEARVTAHGNAARPLVHVRDVASAIAWSVDHRPPGIYNVVGENVRMGELAVTVTSTLGGRLSNAPDVVDSRDYMASGSKLLTAGWHPSRTVAASLEELREHTLPLHLSEHVRLHQLRRLMDAGVLDSHLRYAA